MRKLYIFLIFYLMVIFAGSNLSIAHDSVDNAQWGDFVCTNGVDLEAISFIESSGIPSKYNEDGGERGLFQISPILLLDYNRIKRDSAGVEWIKQSELFDPQINEMVARWYIYERIPHLLKHYGLEVDLINILWAYNCGIDCVVDNRMPLITLEYIGKYCDRAFKNGTEPSLKETWRLHG